MTFKISTNPTFEIGDKSFGGEPIRLNDGSLVIRDDAALDDDDVVLRLVVPRAVTLKRGAPYNTPDAAQEAFARRVVDLLNGESS